MATQTMPYISSAGGAVTINLQYNDRTNVVTAIVATNNASEPATFSVTDNVTGTTVSRTWQPGTAETLAIPGNYRFRVNDVGMMLEEFSASFVGPAMVG